MAIFDKGDTESNTTIIAAGTEIEGEFHITCKLHVDGKISGKIDSSNVISIGSQGEIKGDLTARKLIVKGVFDGVAECESIELLKEGKIIGKISTNDLMIESNAVFEGECRFNKDKDDQKDILEA
ncbi:MAG: cell shape determination protein CcmA [Epsilonproteobacteria bacterium]|nr:cell shape determination protein CcmA [Campylobacterota bacterium]